MTVFLPTFVARAVPRMELPSVNAATMRIRVSVGRTFAKGSLAFSRASRHAARCEGCAARERLGSEGPAEVSSFRGARFVQTP